MHKRHLVTAAILAFGVLSWAPAGNAATSSCVTCHLDEEKLIETLAPVKGKKSAMQSGAG